MKFEAVFRRRFLAAGAERFFERHAKHGYRPLSPGDKIENRLRLEFRL